MIVVVLSASLALHGVGRPALLRSPPVAMQLFGRGRAKRAVEAPTQICVGANLPDVEIEALLFQLPTETEGGSQATDVKAAVLPLTKARRMCTARARCKRACAS